MVGIIEIGEQRAFYLVLALLLLTAVATNGYLLPLAILVALLMLVVLVTIIVTAIRFILWEGGKIQIRSVVKIITYGISATFSLYIINLLIPFI